MFERLKGRQGLICLGFGVWAVTTFGHFFISAPQTLQNSPRPAAARVMERTRSLLSEEEVEEEEEEVEEAGRYEAWWQEQLERRVRVAQTCVRLTFLFLDSDLTSILSTVTICPEREFWRERTETLSSTIQNIGFSSAEMLR